MSDIVERLRAITGQAGDYGDVQLCDAAADEIDRLRSRPCPYVTGNVTKYCTLTPPTLTDAEREAIKAAAVIMDARNRLGGPVMFRGSERAAALRGLLERHK